MPVTNAVAAKPVLEQISIVAETAEEKIIAGAADKRVVAASAVEKITAAQAEDEVAYARAEDVFVIFRTGDRICRHQSYELFDRQHSSVAQNDLLYSRPLLIKGVGQHDAGHRVRSPGEIEHVVIVLQLLPELRIELQRRERDAERSEGYG